MHSTVSIKQAFVTGWKEVVDRPSYFMGLVFIPITVIVLLNIAPAALTYAPELEARFLAGILFLLMVILGALFRLGLIRVALEALRGNYPDLWILLSEYRLLWKYFAIGILYGIAVVIGFILLIVPGIILLLRGSMIYLVLVDEGLGPIETLKRSFVLTKGHTFKIFLFFLVLMLVNIAGFMLLGLGLLFTIPFSLLAWAHLYRQLNPGSNTNIVSPQPVV